MKVQTNVPNCIKEMSTELQDLIKKYGADSFSIYISGPDTPYGIIWINGNTKKILSGIHTMIYHMANDTGKSEEEIVKMILSARSKKV